MHLKIDDEKLKAYYMNLWWEAKKYNGHCDSLVYYHRKMETIQETLQLLGLEADWLNELKE